MFSLDGRIRFQLTINPADELRFHNEKLREIVMVSRGDAFNLQFLFSGLAENSSEETDQALPEYVLVLTDDQPTQETTSIGHAA